MSPPFRKQVKRFVLKQSSLTSSVPDSKPWLSTLTLNPLRAGRRAFSVKVRTTEKEEEEEAVESSEVSDRRERKAWEKGVWKHTVTCGVKKITPTGGHWSISLRWTEETGPAGCQDQGGFSSGDSTPDQTGSGEVQLRCVCPDQTRTLIRFNIQKMQLYLNQR